MFPIELIDVSKSYKAVENSNENLLILSQINFCLEQGQSTAIIGKSGSGKSTLLHVACGLDSPTTGKVIANGKELSQLNDKEKAFLRNTFFGFIFQNNLLLEDFTAIENVMVPSLILGKKKEECLERAKSLLESINIGDRLHHYPKQMSGGEKQRVAICRALMVPEVKVILADEPTGSLDEENQAEVEDLLLNLVKQENKSLLLVTHNTDFANKCDNCYLLQNKGLTKIK